MDPSSPPPLVAGNDSTTKNENGLTRIGPSLPPTLPENQEEDNYNSEGLIDITNHITKCAESLTYTNPLVCIESFSLMDSMSALVLMDPSMDSCQQQQITPSSSSSATTTNILRKAPTSLLEMSSWNIYLPTTKTGVLTYENIKDYSYEILIRLDALISGCGVAESTFTCLYAHDNILEDMRDACNNDNMNKNEENDDISSDKNITKVGKPQRILYAITLLFVKVCTTVRSIVQHADIYEEEDFVMNAYNFRFFPNSINDDELTTTVNDTLKMIMLKKNENDDDDDSIKGIWLCLGFLWNFYKCCNSLTKMENITQQVAKTKRMLHSSTTQLHQLEKLFSLSNNTSSSSISSTIFLKEAFDNNINRNLFGNAPVRKVEFKSFIESVQHLQQITNEFNTNVCDFLLQSTSLQRTKNILRRFNTTSLECNIVTRSLLILNLYFDDLFLGQYKVVDFIAQALVDETGVNKMTLLEEQNIIIFLNRLGKPIYDSLKVYLLNKNRQRDYIENFMFREWSSLQKEVIPISNSTATSPYLTNYILFTTMEIMDHFHMLSLEVQLVHGSYDYCIAYWYRTFILSAMINLSVAMFNAKKESQLLEQHEALLLQRQQQQSRSGTHSKNQSHRKGNNHNSRSGNKKNNGGNSSSAKKQQHNTDQIQDEEEEDTQLLILGLRRSLCRGMAQYITALYQSKYLQKPKGYEFTTDEQRFIKRFEPFSLFQQPPHLQYDDYIQGTDYTNVTPTDLIASASECFKTSKLLADKLLALLNNNKDTTNNNNKNDNLFLPLSKEELVSLVKVCVGNLLYLHILNQKITLQKEVKKKQIIKFDFDTHVQFCIIQI